MEVGKQRKTSSPEEQLSYLCSQNVGPQDIRDIMDHEEKFYTRSAKRSRAYKKLAFWLAMLFLAGVIFVALIYN